MGLKITVERLDDHYDIMAISKETLYVCKTERCSANGEMLLCLNVTFNIAAKKKTCRKTWTFFDAHAGTLTTPILLVCILTKQPAERLAVAVSTLLSTPGTRIQLCAKDKLTFTPALMNSFLGGKKKWWGYVEEVMKSLDLLISTNFRVFQKLCRCLLFEIHFWRRGESSSHK